MVLHEAARRVLAETRQAPLLEIRLHQAEVPPPIHVGRLAPRALRVSRQHPVLQAAVSEEPPDLDREALRLGVQGRADVVVEEPLVARRPTPDVPAQRRPVSLITFLHRPVQKKDSAIAVRPPGQSTVVCLDYTPSKGASRGLVNLADEALASTPQIREACLAQPACDRAVQDSPEAGELLLQIRDSDLLAAPASEDLLGKQLVKRPRC